MTTSRKKFTTKNLFQNFPGKNFEMGSCRCDRAVLSRNRKQLSMIFSKNHLTQVKKRDGRVVPFDENRIMTAIAKAMSVTGEGSRDEAQKVSEAGRRGAQSKDSPQSTFPRSKRSRMSSRPNSSSWISRKPRKRTSSTGTTAPQIRESKQEIPERVKALFDESKKYFQ